MTQPLHIGLLGAMPEEIGSISATSRIELQRPRRPENPQGIMGRHGAPQPGLERLGQGERCPAATRLLAGDPASICCIHRRCRAADPYVNGMWCWPMPWCNTTWMPTLFPRFTLPALKQDRLQPQPAVQLGQDRSAGSPQRRRSGWVRTTAQRAGRHGRSLHRRSGGAASTAGCPPRAAGR